MELLDRLKTRLPEAADGTQDALLEELILSAKEKFLELRYPVTEPPTDENGQPAVESRWHGWIISAAVELYAKMGAESEVSHSENGISRSYQSADLSTDLCGRVTPVVGIIR